MLDITVNINKPVNNEGLLLWLQQLRKVLLYPNILTYNLLEQYPLVQISHSTGPELILAQTFSTVAVSTNPKTVSASAKLTFLAQTSASTGLYATGDTVTFQIAGGYFVPSTDASLCTSMTPGITVTACTLTANQVIVQISTTVSTRNFQVQLQNYYNPFSTTPVTGIKTILKNSAGTQRAIHSTATLQNLIADTLTIATISPQSQLIGASGVSVRFSFTLKNTIYSNGMVKVYFPRWNPDEGDLAFHQIQVETPTCSNILNMNPLMSCSYSLDTQILTISNPVISTTIGGSQLTFEVDSFLNPYSGMPRTGFTIVTTDSVGGEIDSTVVAGLTITLIVTQWAEFTTIKINRLDTQTIVGELSTGSIDFTLDLPIDANCRLEVKYPTDMPLTSAMTTLTSTGIISVTEVSPTSFTLATNSFYIEGCANYMPYITNTLTMYKMKNKGHVMDTFSFSVYLWTIDINTGTTYPIAKRETGVYFRQSQFTMGTITKFQLTPVESTEVQDHTRYILQLWPVHDMPQSSKITVQFPQSINLTEGSCFVQSPQTPITTDALCKVQSNLVTITDPFGASGTFAANPNGLKFIFSSGGENPLSEKDSGTYYVDTYAIVDNAPYHIDTNFFNSVFTPTRGTIAMNVFDITSYETYNSEMTYTFQITPTKKMPQYSIIKIEIPPVITLAPAYTKVPKCTYFIKGNTQVSTAIETLEVSQRPYLQVNEQAQTLGQMITPRIIIKISDAFSDKWYLDPGTPIVIFCEGFRNPRTTRVTASFKIHSTDKDGYYLEDRMSGITTQMLTRPNMPKFDVQMSNFTNGAINTYTMSTLSPLPHFSGDILQFQFPSEIILANVVSCSPLGTLTAIQCMRLDSHLVQATLTFQNGFIEVGTEIKFLFHDVQNSPDTRLSSPFSNVMLLDPLQYQLTQYLGITTLLTLYFAIVQEKKLTQTNYGLLLPSDYTITYTTINRMPPGCSFLITYPDTVQPPVTLSTCRVVYDGLTFDLYGCAVDLDNGIISISGGFNTAVTANSQIAITFGPVMTPISQLNPGKFTLQAYIGTAYRYFIDEIPEGIIPIFECDHPCRTCALPNRGDCLSCKTNVPTEVLVYLEQKRCISVCPDGKFGNLKNDKICEFCPDECLTCWDELTCTRCKGNYPLTELLNGWCVTSCPPGLCPINFKCQPCNAPPFASITVTPDPSTVGKVSHVKLTANLAAYTNTFFGDSDVLWLLIPAPGVFIPSDDPSQAYRAKLYKDYFSDITLCQSVSQIYCKIDHSKLLVSQQNTVPSI